jgi:hypothetical protein
MARNRTKAEEESRLGFIRSSGESCLGFLEGIEACATQKVGNLRRRIAWVGRADLISWVAKPPPPSRSYKW